MAFDQSARDPNALKRELEAALLASQQITGTLIAAVAGAPNRTMVRVALERAIAPCKAQNDALARASAILLERAQ